MLEELKEIYNKTKFPFVYVVQLKHFNRKEANELFKKGLIRKRRGINGDLIELII